MKATSNPSAVTAPPSRERYYITQETTALLRRLSNGEAQKANYAQKIAAIADSYREQMLDLLRDNLESTKILFSSEELINEKLREQIQRELEQDHELQVICLDRFLLEESPFPIRRFEITRLTDDTKDARPGSPSIDQQLSEIAEATGERKILLVDDGLFTGGSIRDAMKMLITKGLSIEKVIAYVRDPKQAPIEIEGVPVSACLEMTDLKDWIDFRDFLTFCGRTYPKAPTDEFYTTQYYLAPSDNGKNASLDTLPQRQFLQLSRRALEIEDDMLGAVEKDVLGRPLLVSDIVQKGFAVSKFPNIDLPPETEKYREYILRARKVLDAMLLPNPDRVVLDMDGTFYPLDGFAEGFIGSRLEKEIEAGALRFIMAKEGCNESAAVEIFQRAKEDPIGPSRYLGKCYNCSRSEYFENTWGTVNEEKIVQPSIQTRQLLDEFKAKTKGMILLTSAPKVWVQKVMRKLQIEPSEYFSEIFTAEDFNSKADVFTELANKHQGETIISVGDTPSSDIEPALNVGFVGFLVNRTNPLTNLLFAGTLNGE